MQRPAFSLLLAFSIALGPCTSLRQLPAQESEPARKVLRIGMIGLDTSHAPEFTKLIQQNPLPEFPAQVTVAFPGGSPDLPSSRDRVSGYTDKLREMGVKIVGSLSELIEQCDAVLLESVDGRPHFEQVQPVLEAGLRVFIDKPLAANFEDARKIRDLAAEKHGEWFSSSSLRFSPSILRFRTDPEWAGHVQGAVAWSPCSLEPTHTDLYWYGIHGVEALYTVMGTGCQTVTRSNTEGCDVVTGLWKDGRIGTFRGIRKGQAGYGLVVFGDKGIDTSAKYEGYAPLVHEILRFFHGGPPPVSSEETMEIMAFMSAAQASKDRGGVPVSLSEFLNGNERSN